MTRARVHIIGTGLLGTSLGLALTKAGHPVSLADASPTAVRLAADMGAGDACDPTDPDIVVVATPPDVAARTIVDALGRWPRATVTDVASVKTAVLAEARELAGDPVLERYIGCHPMAGRERSGAIAARDDLFLARPWVVCSDEDTPAERLAAVVALAEAAGATVVHLDPEFHDSAVARVSHAPQVLASLMAGRLRDMPADGVALAGQGLRDVTRIAASDPGLWTQILAGNAAEVRTVLSAVRDDLDALIDALDLRSGALATIAGLIAAGNEGHDRIPGKHGQAPEKYSSVTVFVDDTPGTLARLFADIGDLGVNVEDIRIDHATGIKLGSVDISVIPSAQVTLTEGLAARDWWVPEAAIEHEGRE
ncbi:prephenate dehydrogenase [Brevibacterium ihuae]|uniref:prephenate dehydrogenase n=1 Tax=Brevibacterium ihuae TaxID=1631743 RepID=UPI000C774085|nr:prephenate dehydrogenase [Brevibacterium ihuae]